VEAFEQVREGKRDGVEVPLFDWGHESRLRVRSRGSVRWVEERDVVAREEWARHERESRARATAASRQAPLPLRVRVWGAEGVLATVGLLLAGLMVASLYRVPKRATADAARVAHESERVAVGDSVSAAVPAHIPMSADDTKLAVGRSLPEEPLAGQRKPPCNRFGEVEIRGGCWFALRDGVPPCRAEGKEDAYAWKGACYTPSYTVGRQPISDLP
jgi:eukaryotic-like serine/threonine-protein kinase